MQQADNRTGSVSFSSLTNFLLGIPRTWSGQGNGLAAIVARNDMFDTFGFYAQDDWRALPRLTVNLGLRWESMTVPNETGGYENALRNPLTDANPTPGPMFTNPTSPINLGT
jgi:outer membrane receptor protein involved in Fe transport